MGKKAKPDVLGQESIPNPTANPELTNMISEINAMDFTGGTGEAPRTIYPEYDQSRYGDRLDEVDPRLVADQGPEEILAAKQSTLAKWGNAGGKALGLAGTTAIEGIIGLPIGVANAIQSGDFEGFYNNPFAQKLDQFTNWMEQALPNYYSQEERDLGFGAKLGTANFWADSILKNLGFMAGAYLTGMAASGAAGSLMRMGKLAQQSKLLSGAAQSGKSFAGLEGAALMDEMAVASGKLSRRGAAQQLIASATAAKAEAGIESRELGRTLDEGREETIMELMRSFEEEDTQKADKIAALEDQVISHMNVPTLDAEGNVIPGITYSRDVMTPDMMQAVNEQARGQYAQATRARAEDEFEKMREGAMNTAFAENAAVLTMGNMVQFGKAFGRGFNADRKTLNTVLRNQKGMLKQYNPFVVRAANVMYRPVWEMTEEQLQGVARNSQVDFVNKKAANAGKADLGQMLASHLEGVKETYGSQQGWEEGFAGFVMGAIGIPGFSRSYTGGINGLKMQGGVWGEIANNRRKAAATKRVVDGMNQYLEKGHFKGYTENLIRHMNLEHDKLQFAEEGDAFNYKNAEHDQFVSDVVTHINAGMFDDLVSKYESLKSSSPEELKEMFSMTNEAGEKVNVFDDANLSDEEIAEKAATVADMAIKHATAIRDTKNIIESRFPNLQNNYGIEGADKITDTLIHYGSTIQNVDDRIGDLSEILGPEIADMVKKEIEAPSQENKNELDKAVREAEKYAPEINVRELSEDLGKLYDRRNTFATYYNNALKGRNLGTIIQENYLKQQEELTNAELEGATNKEIATWAKKKRDAGNFFRVKLAGKKVIKEGYTPKYPVRMKSGEERVYDEAKVEGPNIRVRTGSKWDTIKTDDVANSWDIWMKTVGEKVLTEDPRTEKENEFYVEYQDAVEEYVSLREDRINQLSEGEAVLEGEEAEVYVKVQGLETFEVVDSISGASTKNTIAIADVFDQITSDNTFSAEEFGGIVNRNRRVEALRRLLARKTSLKNTIDEKVNEATRQLQEAEEEYNALINNKITYTQKSTGKEVQIFRDKNGKRIKKNAALKALDALIKKREELTGALADLQASKDSLKEQITGIKQSLSDIKVKEDTPLYTKTTDLLEEANSELSEIDKDITKVKAVLVDTEKAIKKLKKQLLDSLGVMNAILGDIAYNTLGLNTLQKLIENDLISDSYTNQQVVNALNLDFGTGFTGNILLDAITSYEKALDEISDIDGGLVKVLDKFSELEELRTLRRTSQNNINLLQEEIDIIEDELVGIVDNSNLTDALMVETAKHGGGSYSGETTSLKARSVDISNAPGYTTGESFNNTTNDYETPSQKRWFTVTNKLKLTNIAEGNYTLKAVTPVSHPKYFTEEELNTYEARPEGTVGNIKVVLHSNGVPLLEGGEEVFTSIRDIKLEQTKERKGKKLFYTNKFGLEDAQILEGILEFNNFRRNVAEAVNAGGDVQLRVDGISRGVPVTEDNIGGKRQSHNVKGRIISQDASYDSVVLKPATRRRIETELESITVSRSGGLYFIKEGHVVSANLRNLSKKEAEVVFELLQTYASNFATFRGKIFKGSDASKTAAKEKTNKLYSTTGEALSDGILNAISSMIYFTTGTRKSQATGKELAGTIALKGNYLVFGEEAVKFTPEELQKNKELILETLAKATHQVSNFNLKQNDPFTQIVSINEDGAAETKEWPSYKEFLMSDDRADDPIVTTDLVEEGGVQFAATNLHFETGNNEYFPISDEMRAEVQAKEEKKYARPSRKTPKVIRDKEMNKVSGMAAFKKKMEEGQAEVINNIKGEEPTVTEETVTEEKKAPITSKGKSSEFVKTLRANLEGDQPIEEASAPTQENVGVEPNENNVGNQVDEIIPEDQKPKPLTPKGKKPFDPPAFRNENLRKTTNKEMMDKAEAWFKKTFPELDFRPVKEIIDGRAMGAFKDNAVFLWDNAEEGTIFHEAFHVVASLYLGDKAYNEMLNDFRQSKGYQAKMAAAKKSYPELSGEFLELEALAEEFRNYMLANGKYKTPSKIQVWFRKLWDIIRFVRFNHPRTVDNVFNTIRLGAIDTQRIKDIPTHKGRKFYQKIPGMTPKATKDLFEHMTVSFSQKVMVKAGSVSGLLDKEVIKKLDINGIYNEIYQEMQESAPKGSFLDAVTKDWARIVFEHSKYLANIGVSITTNETLREQALMEDVLENEDGLEQGTKGKDSIGYIESINFNTKDGMPNIVKFIFSSLYKRDASDPTSHELNDTFNGYKSADFGKVYNYVATNLAYLTSFSDMVDRLKQISGNVPEINSLLAYLKADANATNFNDSRMKRLFAQQMAKASMKYDLMYLSNDGNIYNIDANSATQSAKIKREWKNQLFKSVLADENPYVTVEGDRLKVNKKSFDGFYAKTSLPGDKGKEAKIFTLALLGITFSDSFKAVNDPSFNAAFESIIGAVRGDFKLYGENISNIYSDKAGLATALNTLSDIEVKYSNRSSEPSHQNPEGNTVYGLTLYNYITLMRAGFLNKKVLQYYENNPMTQNSILLKEIKAGKVFDISISEGAKNANENNSGTKTSQMTSADKIMMAFNNVLSGKYPLIRPGDKSLEYIINHPEFISEKKLGGPEFYEIMVGYLTDELLRIVAHKNSPVLRRVKNFDKKGSKLSIFSDIIKNEELVLALQKVKSADDINEVIQNNIDEILDNVNDYFDRKTADYIKVLEDSKVVMRTEEGNYLNVGISRDIVSEDYITRDTLEGLVYRFGVNYFISNVEQVKLFLGDTSFFKDFFKRTSGMVGTKEIAFIDAETTADLNRNNKRKDKKEADGNFNIVVKNEVEVHSNLVDQYEEAIRDHAEKVMGKTKAAAKKYAAQMIEPYKNIEEADGQGYITLDEYREFMIRVGKWSIEHERLFDRAQAGEEISQEDMFYFQPLKPQYYGPRNVDGVFVPTYLKFSLMPLIPSMVSGTQMESMLNEMTSTQTGVMVYPSAMKVGIQADENGEISEFYNEDGSPNTDMSGAFELDYQFLGIQVDIAPKVKTDTTVGTQTRKMMLSNLFKNGIIQAITRNGEKSQENAEKLVKEYNNSWDAITDLGWQKLLDKFGLEELKDGRFKLADAKALVTTLRIEAEKRNHNSNILQAFDEIFDINTGELTHTFSILPNSDKIQNVMMSMVRTNVMKPKLPGGNKVQGASTGFEFSKRKRSIAAGEKAKKWGSNELLSYRKEDPTDVNSKTLPMQVKLPYYYKDIFGGDIGTLSKEMRTLIGFRIPTDGLHSIDLIEVVDFLPQEAGDLIILPSEIVAKAGSDYDIDKMTLYMPEVYKDKSNKFKKIALDGNYADYKHSHVSNILWRSAGRLAKEWEGFLTREEMGPVVEMLRLESQKKTIDLGVYNKAIELVDSMPEAMQDQFRRSIIGEAKRASKQEENIPSEIDYKIYGHHNNLMATQQAILEAPETFAQMVNPISTAHIKKVAKYTEYLKSPDGGNDLFTSAHFNSWFNKRYGPNPTITTEVSGTKLLEWDNILEVSNAFQGGNAAVGMAANAFGHHVLSQQAGLEYNDTFSYFGEDVSTELNFQAKKGVNYNSLSNTVDADKNYISDTLSGIGNAYIDVANDPFIFQLNAQTDFANVMLMLVRRGVPMVDVGLFMTQPIVEEYMKDFRGNFSMMVRNKEQSHSAPFKSIKTAVPGLDTNVNTDIKYSTEDLANLIYKNKNGIKLTAAELAIEQQVLQDFIRYRHMSKKLRNLVQASKQDTQLVKSLAQQEVKEREIATALAEDNFKNQDKLFSDTILNRIKVAHDKLLPAVGQFFIEYNDRSSDILNPIKDQLYAQHTSGFPISSFEDIGKAIKIVNEEFVTFLLHTVPVQTKGGSFSIYQLQKVLMEEHPTRKRTVALELQEWKTNEDYPLRGNLALEELYPIFDRNGELYNLHNVGMINRKKTTMESDLILDDFRELAAENENLATNLIRVAILQSGKANSPISYMSIIPFEMFSKIVKPILKNYQTNSRLAINWDEFNDQLKKNMKGNGLIVPYESPWVAIPGQTPFTSVKLGPDGIYTMDVNNAANKDYVTSTYIDRRTKARTQVLFKNTGEVIEKVSKKGNPYTLTRFVSDPALGDGYHLKQYYPSLNEANRQAKSPEKVSFNAPGDAKAAKPVKESPEVVKGLKAIAKTINEQFGDEYQLEESVSPKELPISDTQSKELTRKMKSFLAKVGVKYNPTTEIFDANGNPVSATAKANILTKILEIVEGKATVSTLPEEAAHFFVEMLGDNEMLNGMMRGINNTKVLQDTYDVYHELYNEDMTKIKKEAIGKLIMAYVLKDSGVSTDMHDAWINDVEKNQSLLRRIWNWLKKLLSRLSSNVISTYINGYQQAARQMLSGNITGLDIDAGTGEFYQADEYDAKEDTTDSLIRSSAKIAHDDSNGNYIVDGEGNYIRVTDAAKKAQKKPYRDAPSQRDQAKWSIDRTTGTLVHGILSNIVKKHFPLQNQNLEVFTNESIASNPDLPAIAVDLEDSLMSIITETKEMGGYLLSEVKVASVADKIAGTVDLIRVRPDGSVDIFDFKTKSSGRISRGQEKEYTIQISSYAKILEEGSLNGKPLIVHQRRIIPIVKKYENAYRKPLIDFLEENLNSFEDADLLPYRDAIYRALKEAAGLEDPVTGGMAQIPIITESTENEQLDALISKLNKQIALEESKLNKTKESKERERLIESLDKKRALVKSTQLYKDISDISMSAERDLDFIEFHINSEEFNFDNEYRQYLEILKIYRDLPLYVNEEEIDTKTKKQIDSVTGRAGRLYKTLNDKAKEVLVRAADETIAGTAHLPTGEQALELQKATNWWKYLTQGISVTHHPLLASLQKKVTLALGRSRDRSMKTNEKLSALGKAVEEATGKKGPAAFEIFQQLNAEGKKTGNAVSQFTPEYWKRRQEAINENDAEWLDENTIVDQEYFDKRSGWFNDHLVQTYKYTYNAKLKELLEEGKSKKDAERIAEFTAESYAEMLASDWRNKYMVNGEPNILYFNKPKEDSKFLDERYKEIQASKPLREFYDQYLQIIEEARESLPMDINRNFWPNFTSSFLELVSTVGMKEAVKGMSKNAVTRLEAGADPWTYGLQTPSSEEVKEIPMSGLSNIDPESKSYDLPKVMAAFAESMYRHQELEKIHGLALATNQFVKDQAQGQGEVIKNSDGTTAKDSFGQPVSWVSKTGNFTAKQLDDFVESIFYGKSRNDRNAKVKMPDNKLTKSLGIEGKTMNAMKVLDGGIMYTALRNLGLNMFSPTVNLLQGTTAALMEGGGGRYYTVQDFLKAAQLITTHDKKTWAIIDEFSHAVGQREFTRQMRKEMTTVKGGKISPVEALFKLQEIGELAVQYAVMIAAMRGKNAHKFGIKFSDVELKDGKISWPNGEPDVDTKTIFTAKVNAVNKRIVGNYDPDDRASAKRYFAGRAIMQHRTWLPAMFDNRWGSERYDFVLEENFIGRYRVLGKKAGWDILKAMARKGFFFTNTSQLQEATGAEEHYIHAIKANLTEMMLIAMTLLLRWGLSAGDDEDSTGVEKYTMRTLERLSAEMMFFISPNQAWEVLQSPAPSVAAFTEFGRVFSHTGQEIWGAVFDNPELQEKAQPWKYAKRQFPVVGQIDRFVEFLEED